MVFPQHDKLYFDTCAESDDGRGEPTKCLQLMLHLWDLWGRKHSSCSVCLFLVGLVSRGNRHFWVDSRDDFAFQGLTKWITPATAARYWRRHVVHRGRDWFLCLAEKTVQGHAVPNMQAISHVMTVLVTPNRGKEPVAIVFDPFEVGVEGTTFLPRRLPSILKHMFCRGCNPHALGVRQLLWIRGEQSETEMTCMQNALDAAQCMVRDGPGAWLAQFPGGEGMTLTRKGFVSRRHSAVHPRAWLPWL